MNKVFVDGRVTKDAEHHPGDQERVTFSLANNESYKTKEGEWKDNTTFFDVTIWKGSRKLADALSKGRLISVEGKMNCSIVEKDGQKRRYWRIVADKINWYDRANTDHSEAGNSIGKGIAEVEVEVEDDLPF